MNTQTKDSLKKLAIIILFENSLKGKNYMKKLTFYFRHVVKITAISNNACRPPNKAPPHTTIHFFMHSFC